MMPISDPDGYDKGHFARVYEHLIKPACENAGFLPIRADEVAQTNHIVLDVVQKIVEYDMAICDLSSRNPNVLYELGIRQAFNKPVVLLKDDITANIFDISGIRYIQYEKTLRIDNIKSCICSLVKSIDETYHAKDNIVNSILKLLALHPAVLPTQSSDLSPDTKVIMNALQGINDRIGNLEEKQRLIRNMTMHSHNDFTEQDIGQFIRAKLKVGEILTVGDKTVGKVIQIAPSAVFAENNGTVKEFKYTKSFLAKAFSTPF